MLFSTSFQLCREYGGISKINRPKQKATDIGETSCQTAIQTPKSRQKLYYNNERISQTRCDKTKSTETKHRLAEGVCSTTLPLLSEQLVSHSPVQLPYSSDEVGSFMFVPEERRQLMSPADATFENPEEFIERGTSDGSLTIKTEQSCVALDSTLNSQDNSSVNYESIADEISLSNESSSLADNHSGVISDSGMESTSSASMPQYYSGSSFHVSSKENLSDNDMEDT